MVGPQRTGGERGWLCVPVCDGSSYSVRTGRTPVCRGTRAARRVVVGDPGARSWPDPRMTAVCRRPRRGTVLGARDREGRHMSIALVRNEGDGKAFHYYNAVHEQVVTTAETGGAVTVMRLIMRREAAPPLHCHSREDESWVVLSGRVRFWVGSDSLDECDVHDAETGAYVFGPRFVPHTFQPITAAAEILVINNPGAIEGYFQSVGSADDRHDADHADLLGQYGVVLLDNPPPA